VPPRHAAAIAFWVTMACSPTPPAEPSPAASGPARQPALDAPAPPVAPPPPSVAVVEPEAAEHPQLDIEYVPTPDNVVAVMLEMAKVGRDDVVYDLGCGDGRLVVEAARRFGARGVGIDLDPERVAEARANVEQAGVGHLVTIEQRNIFSVDLSPATVVTLYLLPKLNVRLMPQLEQLRPGARIVSHDFDMEGADYDEVVEVISKHHRPPPEFREHYVYRWTTPLKKTTSSP
jgi:SAM-dependent methyltransferase